MYRVFEEYFPINSSKFSTDDGKILLEYPVTRFGQKGELVNHVKGIHEKTDLKISF